MARLKVCVPPPESIAADYSRSDKSFLGEEGAEHHYEQL